MGNQIPQQNQPVLNQFLSNLPKQNGNRVVSSEENAIRQSRSQPAQSLKQSPNKNLSFNQFRPNQRNIPPSINNPALQGVQRTISPSKSSQVRFSDTNNQSNVRNSRVSSPIKNLNRSNLQSNLAESTVQKFDNNFHIKNNSSNLSNSKASSSSQHKSIFNQFVSSIMNPSKIKLPLPSISQNSYRAHSAQSSHRTSRYSQSTIPPKMIQIPQNKFHQITQKADNLIKQLSQTKKQVDIGHYQLQQQKKRNQMMSRSLQTLSRQKYQMKNTIVNINRQLYRLTQLDKTNKFQLEKLTLQNKQASQYITDLQANINNKAAIINENQELISNHQDKIAQQDNQLQKINNQYETILNLFNNIKQQLELLKQDKIQLQHNYSKLSNQNSILNNANTFWKNQNNQLTKQCDILHSQMDKIRSQLHQVRQQANSLKQQVHKYEKIKQQYEKAKIIGQNQIDSLQSTINQLQTIKQHKRTDKLFERQLIYELKAENQKLWDKIIKINEELEDNPENAKKNIQILKNSHSQHIHHYGNQSQFEKVFKTVHSQNNLHSNHITDREIELRNRYENFIKNLQNNVYTSQNMRKGEPGTTQFSQSSKPSQFSKYGNISLQEKLFNKEQNI